MSQMTDPFAFQELPKPEDHVNEAFTRLNMREADAPALHAFLVQALAPTHKLTPQNAQSYCGATDKILAQIVSDIEFARSKCQPYFEHPTDLPEHLMIVTAMSSLPDLGYRNMQNLMRNQFYSPTMVEANALFFDMQRLDHEQPLKGSIYPSLGRSGKLMAELKACLLAKITVVGFQKGHGPEVMSQALRALSHYRRLMTGDSEMAKKFREIDTFIGARLRQDGAPKPPKPLRPLGTALREHAQMLGLTEIAAPSEQPVQQAGNVVAVSFGRPRPKPL